MCSDATVDDQLDELGQRIMGTLMSQKPLTTSPNIHRFTM